MRRTNRRRIAALGTAILALAGGLAVWGLGTRSVPVRASDETRHSATTDSRTPATAPAQNYGPDVVMLRELADKFEPVPFNHRVHARMADMWDGCLTCHHRPPHPKAEGEGPRAEGQGPKAGS